MIYELDQIFKGGQEILCTDKCPCNVDSGIFSTEIAAEMVTNNMGATRLDQCPYESAIINATQRAKYYPILEILETDWQCAGFCEDGDYYLFSDVRNGVPKNGNCKQEIVDSVKNNATPFSVVLISLGLVGLIGMAASFAICNMTSRKFKGEAPYNFAKYGMTKDD